MKGGEGERRKPVLGFRSGIVLHCGVAVKECNLRAGRKMAQLIIGRMMQDDDADDPEEFRQILDIVPKSVDFLFCETVQACKPAEN